MSADSITACHRSVGSLFVILMAVLSSTGDAFKLYELLSGEDVAQRSQPEVYASLEECTSHRCNDVTLSRVTRAMCVLQCVVKTTSADPDSDAGPSRHLPAHKLNLEDRTLDPTQACIEAKCVGSERDYYECAFQECYGRRDARSNGGDQWGHRNRQRDLVYALQRRRKRIVEQCTYCHPGSVSWQQCKKTCRK